MSTNNPNLDDIDIRVIKTEALDNDDLRMVHQLFDLSYRQANHSYLERSFSKLRYIALAQIGKILAGFAVADTVKTHLPRLADPQIVSLAGICCVDPKYRRMGLFTKLEVSAADGSGLLKTAKRLLMCGRMAHPVSYRTIGKYPSVIPKYGVSLSGWHKDMGLKVSELYGVTIDPETLHVIGDGSPCGYPNIDCEVTEQEWLLFKEVNRDRGDTLLGIIWVPDAPEGW